MVNLDRSVPFYLSNYSVVSELYQFKTKNVVRNAIKKTDLNVRYMQKLRLRNIELYKKSPFLVEFVEVDDNFRTTFNLTVIDENSVRLSKTGDNAGTFFNVKVNQITETPVGKIIVTRTPYYNKSWKSKSITVQRQSVESLVGFYQGNISSKPKQRTNIVEFTAHDYSRNELRIFSCTGGSL